MLVTVSWITHLSSVLSESAALWACLWKLSHHWYLQANGQNQQVQSHGDFDKANAESYDLVKVVPTPQKHLLHSSLVSSWLTSFSALASSVLDTIGCLLSISFSFILSNVTLRMCAVDLLNGFPDSSITHLALFNRNSVGFSGNLLLSGSQKTMSVGVQFWPWPSLHRMTSGGVISVSQKYKSHSLGPG